MPGQDAGSLVVVVLAVTGVLVWLALLVAAAARGMTALRARSRLDVEGRWIVVTGCDSGLGRGVLEELVARRARVIATCLTADGAREALARGAAMAPCLDLTDEDALVAAARQIDEASGGRLWGLVHNAGVVLPGFVEYQPIQFYRRVMEVNFFAPVRLTQLLLPSLRRGAGRVVIVSSVDGIVSLPGNAPYDASKFAIEAYADALRAELSLWGLPVSVVNPATMRTPLAMQFFEAHRKAWAEMARLDPEGDWRTRWPEAWLEQYVSFNGAQLARIAEDPAVAVRDIVHAVTAARPRLRYLSGRLARTLFRALWLVPEGWSLAFKRSMIQPRPPGVGARGAR